MAEAVELPSTWSKVGQNLHANSLWMLPLVALERAFDEHPYQAAIAGAFWLIAAWAAVKYHVLQELTTDHGRRRQLLTWALIIAGAVLLGAGIYRLATEQGPSNGSATAPAAGASETERQLAATQRELQETQHQLALAQQQPGPSPVPVARGTFTKKTIRELRALYEGRTALQADAFMADEKGKLIDVEGTIVRVDSGMAFLQSGDDSIECRFGLEWNSKLSTFRNGELMKVRGTIGPAQNGAQIYLQQCELRD